MKLFRKPFDFFEIFDQAANNLTKATAYLVELCSDLSTLDDKARKIYDIEQKGDALTHEVMRRLKMTTVTPEEREDIRSLASRIDDILDLIWSAVDRMTVYKLKESTPEALEISKALHTNTEVIEQAITHLREKKFSFVHDNCIEINRLENHVDRIFRDALGRLFENISDPILIIKWKDLYEHLENATDRCEDVADILEGIVLKNS